MMVWLPFNVEIVSSYTKLHTLINANEMCVSILVPTKYSQNAVIAIFKTKHLLKFINI